MKQQQDHDPQGEFVRRWIPPGDYPAPIVDHAEAVEAARARLAEFRRRAGVRDEILAVTKKHGSRKRTVRKRAPKPPAQAELFG